MGNLCLPFSKKHHKMLSSRMSLYDRPSQVRSGWRKSITSVIKQHKKDEQEYEMMQKSPPTLEERQAAKQAEALARRKALEKRNSKLNWSAAGSCKKNAETRYENAKCKAGRCV